MQIKVTIRKKNFHTFFLLEKVFNFVVKKVFFLNLKTLFSSFATKPKNSVSTPICRILPILTRPKFLSDPFTRSKAVPNPKYPILYSIQIHDPRSKKKNNPIPIHNPRSRTRSRSTIQDVSG